MTSYGVDPLYGYGTSAAAASSPYASDPIAALSQDMSGLSQPYLDAYDAQLSALEQQSSIFGGDYMSDSSINPANIDASDLYRQMRQIQEDQMDYNMHQAEKYRLNGAQVNAPYNRMKFAAQTLQEKIVEDEQAQIMPALRMFVEAYKEAYDPNDTLDEETLLANACAEYQNLTGNNLLVEIKQNSKGAFVNGLLRAVTFGAFGQKQSADETISQITGQPVSESSKSWQITGAATGVASYTAAGAGIGACFGGPAGAGIGAVIGFIVGGIGALVS